MTPWQRRVEEAEVRGEFGSGDKYEAGVACLSPLRECGDVEKDDRGWPVDRTLRSLCDIFVEAVETDDAEWARETLDDIHSRAMGLLVKKGGGGE